MENKRLLKSLGNADADLNFPFVVRFGDSRKLDFTVTKRINVDSSSVLYLAYRLKGQWNERVPVIIKSYKASSNTYRDFISDLHFYRKESRIITVDFQHCNIALVKTKGVQEFYQGEEGMVDPKLESLSAGDDGGDYGLGRAKDSSLDSEEVEAQNISNEFADSDNDTKRWEIDNQERFQKKIQVRAAAESPLHKKSNFYADDNILGTNQYSTESLEESDSKAVIRSLWNPTKITLPLTIMISDGTGKEEFIVKEKVGSSIKGAIYKGFFSNTPSRILVLKVFRGITKMESFKNEITALSKLSRLVKADHQNALIVESSGEGPFILDVWSELNKNKESEKFKSLLQKYQQIPEVLKEKYGVINVNVQPYNVVVDNEENLHVLDLDGVRLLDASNQEGEVKETKSTVDSEEASRLLFV